MMRHSRLSYRSVSYWSKEHQWDAYWGAKKYFFNCDMTVPPWRALVESCQTVAPVSLGALRDGIRHGQSPTGRHARALPSIDTLVDQLSQPTIGLEPKSPRFSIQRSLETTKRRRMY